MDIVKTIYGYPCSMTSLVKLRKISTYILFYRNNI